MRLRWRCIERMQRSGRTCRAKQARLRLGLALREFGREFECELEHRTERETGLVFAGVSLKENFYEQEQRKAADG